MNELSLQTRPQIESLTEHNMKLEDNIWKYGRRAVMSSPFGLMGAGYIFEILNQIPQSDLQQVLGTACWIAGGTIFTHSFYSFAKASHERFINKYREEGIICIISDRALEPNPVNDTQSQIGQGATRPGTINI